MGAEPGGGVQADLDRALDGQWCNSQEQRTLDEEEGWGGR